MKVFRLSLFHILVIPPVIFTMAIGYVGSSTYQSMVTANINEFLFAEAQHIQEETSDFVLEHFHQAESFLRSNAAYVEMYLDEGRLDTEQVLNLFTRQLHSSETIDYLYFTTMTGQIVSVGKSGSFAYSTAEEPLTFRAVTTSATGDNKETVRQVDFRDKSWFSNAIAAGSIQWSEPYPGELEDTLAISASYPVMVNGKLAGVMGIDILLEELSNFLNHFDPVKSGNIYITNGDSLLGSNVPITEELLKTELNSAKTSAIVSRNNEDYFRTLSELPTTSGNNWKLITLQPVAGLQLKFVPLFQHLKMIMLTMALFVLVFSVTISIFLKGKILSFIRFLKTLESNHWRASAPDSSIKELNQIAQSVNQVLKTLNLTLDSLGIDRKNEVPKHPHGTSLEQIIIEKSAQLKQELLLDPLTGVYNRRFLTTTFEELDPQLVSNYCLALLDLDYFKQVNDQHGHAIGDAVLREFVINLKSFLRKNDVLFRYGGEEFVVLFNTAVIDEAQQALFRYKLALEQTLLTENRIKVSFSAGLTELGSTNLNSELKKADKAMYQAKEYGRNHIVIYQPKQTG